MISVTWRFFKYPVLFVTFPPYLRPRTFSNAATRDLSHLRGPYSTPVYAGPPSIPCRSLPYGAAACLCGLDVCARLGPAVNQAREEVPPSKGTSTACELFTAFPPCCPFFNLIQPPASTNTFRQAMTKSPLGPGRPAGLSCEGFIISFLFEQLQMERYYGNRRPNVLTTTDRS